MLLMQDLDLTNKRVLIREDLNVPLSDTGQITNENRLIAALPTVQLALEKGASVILMSHLGRPKEGEYEAKYSLAVVAKRLSELLAKPVRLEQNWQNGVAIQAGEVVLLENIRFSVGEKANNQELSCQLANLCDVFVMDAFATAHRAQASTYGVIKHAPVACAGPLLQKEVAALEQTMASPRKPVLAIVGGAKVSSKLALIANLIKKVDCLLLGGGIANTFLAAQGYPVGKSLYEPDLIEMAKEIINNAAESHCELLLPSDVRVAQSINANAADVRTLDGIQDNEAIFDIGPESEKYYADKIMAMGTIIWNGPVGLFEKPAFSIGTQVLAEAIAESSAYSLAGGGDTVAAVAEFGITKQIDYISTGGGAFLEVMEGKTLPALAALAELSREK